MNCAPEFVSTSAHFEGHVVFDPDGDGVGRERRRAHVALEFDGGAPGGGLVAEALDGERPGAHFEPRDAALEKHTRLLLLCLCLRLRLRRGSLASNCRGRRGRGCGSPRRRTSARRAAAGARRDELRAVLAGVGGRARLRDQ